MSFAWHYLQRHTLFVKQIETKAPRDLGLVVVIPCYNEPDILRTIESLKQSEQPSCSVELIVAINSSEDTCESILVQNRHTELELKAWANTNNRKGFTLHVLHQDDLPRKHAGAGLARKIGMDEAVRRFSEIDNPDGILVSFDADTRCADNYLSEIYSQFKNRPKSKACSIYFEHPIKGNEFSPQNYSAIAEYELYLRYYNQALRYTGYPWAFHAVGSCFAVKARVYSEQGGMNRKQAGEDFYFLQKVIPLGGFFEITSTCAMPSPRPSDRVPFGTGPMIRSLMKSGKTIETYQLVLFEMLNSFFLSKGELFKANRSEVEAIQQQQPKVLVEFLQQNSFVDSMVEVNANSPTLEKFNKRFFKWFNALRILKFLNHSSERGFPRENLKGLCLALASKFGFALPGDASLEAVLLAFRDYEKANPVRS